MATVTNYMDILESPVTEEFRRLCAAQAELLEAADESGKFDKKAFAALDKKRNQEINSLYERFPLHPVVIDWYADLCQDEAEMISLKEMAIALLPANDAMREAIAQEIADLRA
jgi:hypothetical protein